MSPGKNTKSQQCREKDLNLRRRMPADLQSAPFGRSGIPAGVPTRDRDETS